jgi:putative MATE family efflux protein
MQDLTRGSLTRHLLTTSSYMLVSMVFQTLYILVDLYWVGRLGTEAVAAVAISGNLLFVVLAATQMLGVGTTTLVSHATGRKDRAGALLAFNQSQVASIAAGGVFFAAAMAGRQPYAAAMSADAGTQRLAAEYLFWFIPAMTLQFGLVAMGAALRGTGNFRPGMVVQVATVVLNMILAPFLIFGWGTGHPFGVAGAALATLLAIVVGSIWLAIYFLPPEAYLKFVRADMWPRLPIWGSLLKVGLPAGAEFALMAVYLSLVYSVSRPFGAAAQAGFGIGLRVIQAFFLPVVALGFAVAPVAGQNYGARLGARVRQTFTSGVALASGIMLAVAAGIQVAPVAVLAPFSSDPEVLRVGEEYLRIVSWTFVASGVIFVSSSMFQALGNTLPALVSSLTRLVLVAAPLLALARHPGFELRWIWYLSAGAVVIQMTMNLLLLRREFARRLRFAPADGLMAEGAA